MDNYMSEKYLNRIMIVLLLGLPWLAHWLDEPYYVSLATRIAILALAGVGLNLALGLGGMVSFGHAAFFGIGGYVTGILASHAFNSEPIISGFMGTTQMLIIWPLAMLIAAIVAVFIGLLSLRTSGVYFIMITLAFAQMIYYFSISWPTYGGEDGLPIYVRNGFPGINTLQPIQFFMICCTLLLITLWGVSRLQNSRFGNALQALRQNETRVTSIGINPLGIKLTAFVISATITALAGSLFADLNRFVSPTMFSWHTSGEIMIFVILGGLGRLYGPLAGAGLFILCEALLGGWTEYWQFFLGLLLLGVVLFARGGLIGVLSREQKNA
jgi:branched-chain amino acid transport system permease protein